MVDNCHLAEQPLRTTAVTHPSEIGFTSESARRFGAPRQSAYSCKLFQANRTYALPKTRRVPQMPNAILLCGSNDWDGWRLGAGFFHCMIDPAND